MDAECSKEQSGEWRAEAKIHSFLSVADTIRILIGKFLTFDSFLQENG